MSIIININDLLASFSLHKNESFCLYVYKDDGYDSFGYVGSYKSIDCLAATISFSKKDPDIHGIWITIESDDGTVDDTILKVLEGRKCYV